MEWAAAVDGDRNPAVPFIRHDRHDVPPPSF